MRILWKVHESLLGMLCKMFRGSPEASSEPSQIPDMERFAKIAAISIFAKSRSMLDKLRTGILVWKQLPWEFRECSGNWALFSFVILNEIFPHKDCRQIFFPILSEPIDFYPPWKQQQTIGLLMTSGKKKLINSLKFTKYPANICSKSTIEALEKGAKYAQSLQ